MIQQYRRGARTVTVAAMLCLLALPAAADQWNDKTILTFSGPVMIPGTTLTPGEYVFQLADTASDRNVVRIYKRDGNTLVATTQAIPVKRERASDDVVITVKPTEAGAPVALTAWFYPGSAYGHQFIY